MLSSSLLNGPIHIEVGAASVEGTGAEVTTHGREPMPLESDDCLASVAVVEVDGFLNSAIVPTRPVIMPGVMG
jgi:hypothetical protein